MLSPVDAPQRDDEGTQSTQRAQRNNGFAALAAFAFGVDK
jgi:hypothetical protein